jgi:hypothetical protein
MGNAGLGVPKFVDTTMYVADRIDRIRGRVDTEIDPAAAGPDRSGRPAS